MISQHAVDRILKMRAYPREAVKRGVEWPKCRTTIVTSQDAYIIGQVWKKLSQASHRAFVYVHV
jgi:hypothetical protein